MTANGSAVGKPITLVRTNHWLAQVEDVLNLIAAAAIFFLMFVGVFQIVGRTVFNVPIYGYIDYMEEASAIFAFFGISYCQRLGSHVRMDLLLRGFAKRWMWAVEAFCVLVALAIVTLLVYATFDYFLNAWELGDSTIDIQLPTWPSKLVVAVALAVLWLRLVIQLVDYARLIRDPDAEPIAVPALETVEAQARAEIDEVLGRTGQDGDAGGERK